VIEHNLQSAPAQMAGEARRISAAEKAQMAMESQPAVLRATIHITRKATGKVETYEITGACGGPPDVGAAP
jgi:hypothetical protein